MPLIRPILAVIPTGLAFISIVGGCRSEAYFQSHTPQPAIVRYTTTPSMSNPRGLNLYIAAQGAQCGDRLEWIQMIDAAMWADVVIIGEQHDDAMGHAVQRAVMDDVGARCLGDCCALSMEMLERNEQGLAEDYLDGFIDTKAFAKQTHSENWAGEGSWAEWYQPIIDAAKEHGGRVIAANSPRQYVRLARTQGYERLKEIPQPRRSLFDLPVTADDARYRQRFFEFMSEGSESSVATQPATQPSSQPDIQPAAPASMPNGHGSGPVTPERFEAGYRSQSLWDSTMAASIVDAHRAGAKRIIHLIGQFHCDFHGGTVAQLKARWPGVKLLVISMQREDGDSLREEDRGRADIVVYTGKPPETDQDEAATQPETQPTTSPAAG